MYDKYNKVYPISINSPLTKHKGILLSKTVSNATITGEGFGFTGGTYTMTFYVTSNTPTIIPIEMHKITSLDGATGFLLT